MLLGIIGGGVVGAATAHAFRGPANEVRVFDVDPAKSTHSYEEALDCDIVFVCLPTPLSADSLACDTSILDAFFSTQGGRDCVFVLRSTVPIGYTNKTHDRYGIKNLCHWPEFLTERTAKEDAEDPVRLILGYTGASESRFVSLFELFKQRWPDVQLHVMHSDESEAVKLFQNGFSAVKIAFFNEIYALSDKLDLNWPMVLEGLLAGGWINPMHTQVPGPDGKYGFGGACLPKDLGNLITCLGDDAMVTIAAFTRNLLDRGKEHDSN